MRCFVRCNHCDGSGKVFSPGLTKTLKAVSTRRAMCAGEIFAASCDIGVKINAINNRLAQLRKMGLIVLVRTEGRVQFWQRVRTLRGSRAIVAAS